MYCNKKKYLSGIWILKNHNTLNKSKISLMIIAIFILDDINHRGECILFEKQEKKNPLKTIAKGQFLNITSPI